MPLIAIAADLTFDREMWTGRDRLGGSAELSDGIHPDSGIGREWYGVCGVLANHRDLSALGRRRVAAVWQLPTLLFAVYLAVGLAFTSPALLRGTPTVLALVCIVVASAAAFVVPWERVGHQWRIVVPAADLAAVIVLRYDLVEVRSIGLFSIVPIAWLAFEFGRRGIAIAIVGGVAQSAWTFVEADAQLSTGLAWIQAFLFPLATIIIAAVARSLAVILGTNQSALLASRADLGQAYDLARHRLLVIDTMINIVDAGVCYFDDTGRPLLVNPFARHLFALTGYVAPLPARSPEAAAAGVAAPRDGDGEQSRAERFTGPDVFYDDRVTRVPAMRQIIPRALRGEEEMGRLYWLGPPGDQRAVMVSCRQLWENLHETNARRLGSVVIAVDVTELTEAVEIRDKFLATVSHELRTPLTSIMGHHDLIVDALSDPVAGHVENPLLAKSLESAQRNTSTLLTRIEQLIAASRPPASVSGHEGQTTVVHDAKVALDLAAVVERAQVRHREAAHAQGLRLEVDVRAHHDVEVHPDRFDHALDELITNAIKFTPTGGTVTLEVGDPAEAQQPSGRGAATTYTTVTIQDTGVGMSASELRQAFTRFYRTPYAQRNAIQGLGIGLATAQRIVTAHHGTLTLRSIRGAGTAATIQLASTPTGQRPSRQTGPPGPLEPHTR